MGNGTAGKGKTDQGAGKRAEDRYEEDEEGDYDYITEIDEY